MDAEGACNSDSGMGIHRANLARCFLARERHLEYRLTMELDSCCLCLIFGRALSLRRWTWVVQAPRPNQFLSVRRGVGCSEPNGSVDQSLCR